MRKWPVLSIIVGGLLIVGFGSYLIAKEFSAVENNQNIRLDNRLIIGTYEKVTTSDHNEHYNKIYIEVVQNGDVVEKLIYETDNKLLTKDDNYQGCVFIDMTDLMSKYIDNLGVKFWSLSNPLRNYVRVKTECVALGFISSDVNITDSGLYLVNIPSKKDDDVQVEHCYIYQKNEMRF